MTGGHSAPDGEDSVAEMSPAEAEQRVDDRERQQEQAREQAAETAQ